MVVVVIQINTNKHRVPEEGGRVGAITWQHCITVYRAVCVYVCVKPMMTTTTTSCANDKMFIIIEMFV